MLTNKELGTLIQVTVLLNTIEHNANYDIYQELEITSDALIYTREKVHDMYTKYKAQKIKASKQANAWNKAHPDIHRERNKQYARNKRLKEREVK